MHKCSYCNAPHSVSICPYRPRQTQKELIEKAKKMLKVLLSPKVVVIGELVSVEYYDDTRVPG